MYVYVNLCCAGPPGKQPLAEAGYPVEIKVNNNNSSQRIAKVSFRIDENRIDECRLDECY